MTNLTYLLGLFKRSLLCLTFALYVYIIPVSRDKVNNTGKYLKKYS